MDAYLRQQFDVLLLTAADRLAERAAQRCAGVSNALHQLQHDPRGPGIWLSEFVDAVFAESCLDDVAGACFVLRATAKRTVAAHREGTVTDVLVGLAKDVFTTLLVAKVVEALDRAQGYG